MQFAVRSGAPLEHKTACAVLPVFEDGPATGVTKQFDRALGGRLRALVRAGDASGKLGETATIHAPGDVAAERLLLVGCGKQANYGARQLVAALTAAGRVLAAGGSKSAVSYLAHGMALDEYYIGRLSVEALRAAMYRFTELKSETPPPRKLARVAIAIAESGDAAAARQGVREGVAVADGADLARDLGNRPPNVCTPTHLAEAAKQIAKDCEAMDFKALDERAIGKLGMGAFLSVTQGATEPARLIVLNYRGAGTSEKPVVLCGKGVTFDTGGISLKPPPKMDEMKFDMCGAAGVLGTMKALAGLGAKINVVAIVPACENMPGGSATRPGDIVTSMSGQTIEILNTDAEGRLLLCDALTYAQSFKPRCVIDVATLTGASVIALGALYTAVFTNDDELAAALVAAGERTRDAAWRMPVDAEYGESLRSNFADFANAGAREGGASVAAQFLSRFAGSAPWAHLDIAGVSWHQNANKGATGRPVSLLVDFLIRSQMA